MSKDQQKSDQPSAKKRCCDTQRQISSLWHVRKSCDAVAKKHPFRVGKHVVLELKRIVKIAAIALLRGVLVLMLKDASVSRLAGGFSAIASVGNGRRPHPRLRPEAFEILARGNH
jgi:hypothetical protein